MEIVLGVDNLIFIAILADKLPPQQRDRARVIGLSLALVMRLGLLASITWVMSLTTPILNFWRFEISWRDVILIVGGVFLLIKATTEIHERLEGGHKHGKGAKHAAFWPIIGQIVVLDIVFSLDSVITAVGMVDELPVMMAAVIIAVAAMLFASKPLTRFITAPDTHHPVPRVPPDDRPGARGRRLRLPHPEGLCVCRDRLFGADRDSESARRAGRARPRRPA